MKAPRSFLSIPAIVLLALGGTFTLLGVLGLFAVPIPMRSGGLWMFLPMGLPLLLAGIGLSLFMLRSGRLQTRLRTQGTAVRGRVVRVQYHVYYSYGNADAYSYKRHPWTVLCEYSWEGQTYTVRSPLLWRKPRDREQRPTVYIDPERPKRAWMDPDSLEYEIKLR